MKLYYLVLFNHGVLFCTADSKENAYQLFKVAVVEYFEIEEVKEQVDDFVLVCYDGWVKDIKMIKDDNNVS